MSHQSVLDLLGGFELWINNFSLQPGVNGLWKVDASKTFVLAKPSIALPSFEYIMVWFVYKGTEKDSLSLGLNSGLLNNVS